MKKTWKKFLGVMLIVSLAGVFAGCNKPTDTPSEPGAVTYTLSADKESVALSLGGEEAVESAVITLTTNGTAEVEVESTDVATASLADGKITVTAVGSGTTTITVTLKEDAKKEIEIPVSVVKNTMVLTLTLADDMAVPGGTITVLYGNGGDKKPEAYEFYIELSATVAEDGKSATVVLDKAKANKDGWFNGLKITVKDAEENELNVEYETYFEFSADGYEITVSPFVASTMTVTLEFQDFTATEVKVTYGTGDDCKETVDAVVAADGESATFEVSNDYINNTSWTSILAVTAKDGEDDLNIEFKGTDSWFKFDSTKTDQVMPYALKSEWTEISNAAIGSVDASAFAGKTITKLKIEATNCDWSAVSGDWWIWTTPGNLVWVSNSYYKLEVTDVETIASIVENGLSVSNSEGLSATLVVSYN